MECDWIPRTIQSHVINQKIPSEFLMVNINPFLVCFNCTTCSALWNIRWIFGQTVWGSRIGRAAWGSCWLSWLLLFGDYLVLFGDKGRSHVNTLDSLISSDLAVTSQLWPVRLEWLGESSRGEPSSHGGLVIIQCKSATINIWRFPEIGVPLKSS